MARKSVATDPEMAWADPVKGNFTSDSENHLWCASSLAQLVASPEVSLNEFNEDIQAGIRFLLSCEINRAKKASAGGH